VIDGRSVSMSWCRAPFGAHDQIVRSFSSVFVRHTFDYPNYFKTLKHLTFVTTCFGLYDHHQALKLRFEEVGGLAFF
jgi:hypothetical protein